MIIFALDLVRCPVESHTFCSPKRVRLNGARDQRIVIFGKYFFP